MSEEASPTISIEFTYLQLQALLDMEEDLICFLSNWKRSGDPVLAEGDEEINVAQQEASEKIRAAYAVLYQQLQHEGG